jgi:hypothetical protein
MDFIISILQVAGDYGVVLIKYAVRVLAITAGTLGTVYIMGRLLELETKSKTKNITATLCLLTYSTCITLVYHQSAIPKMVWESFIFGVISAVPYITIGWRFKSRMDSWLDRKFGEDDDKEVE